MPWKTTDAGEFAKDANGNPIFVLEGGEEKSVDYPAMLQSLTRANRESAERKEKLRSQAATLKLLDGIEDVSAYLAEAKKNAETVAALPETQKDAEKAATARVQAAVEPLQKKIAELEAGRADAVKRYHTALIDAQFGTSKYVNEELVNPAMTKELFGKNFSVGDDGRLVAKNAAGNIIYDNDGPAGFDSALRQLVAQSPYRDHVLKGSPASGSGTQAGNGGGGANTLSRAAFDKLPPEQKAKFCAEGGKIA